MLSTEKMKEIIISDTNPVITPQKGRTFREKYSTKDNDSPVSAASGGIWPDRPIFTQNQKQRSLLQILSAEEPDSASQYNARERGISLQYANGHAE